MKKDITSGHSDVTSKYAFTLAEVFLPSSTGQHKYAFTLAEVFFTHFASQRKAAFTLAEVLITLGIIGVVAAMTLPALMQKVEKAILKNQIKKSYSILTQVQQKVMFEWGDALSLDGAWGYKNFNNAMLDSLKILRKCEGNALAKHCVPEYIGLNVKDCGGFGEAAVYNRHTVYILNDGQILIPYHEDWRSLWLIDVNGMKGPNKAGYDLFEVALDSSTKRMGFRGKGCLNQGNPPPVSGGLDDYKDIDKW